MADWHTVYMPLTGRVTFPPLCVCCGQPSSATQTIDLPLRTSQWKERLPADLAGGAANREVQDYAEDNTLLVVQREEARLRRSALGRGGPQTIVRKSITHQASLRVPYCDQHLAWVRQLAERDLRLARAWVFGSCGAMIILLLLWLLYPRFIVALLFTLASALMLAAALAVKNESDFFARLAAPDERPFVAEANPHYLSLRFANSDYADAFLEANRRAGASLNARACRRRGEVDIL